jgi:hypothetical protein
MLVEDQLLKPLHQKSAISSECHEEDPINELESIYDQWQAHEAAQNQVKEEEKDEIEVIIPDFSSLNPIPKKNWRWPLQQWTL